MLSLPLLAHPPRNVDESPAATTIRHAITPPNAVAPGTAAHRPDTNDGSPLPEHPFTPCEGSLADQYPYGDLVRPTSDRQRQYGSQQMIPKKSCRESSGPRFKVGWCFGLGELALFYFPPSRLVSNIEVVE